MILTCNYLASCTSITDSTGHYSCFAVGACCVCRCLSKIGRHDCCLTSEKNDLFKSRIRLRYMYAHRLFTSSSGLCHSGISFVVLYRSHNFVVKKSQNMIRQLEHNDSNLITLLYSLSKLFKFESLCSSCHIKF